MVSANGSLWKTWGITQNCQRHLSPQQILCRKQKKPDQSPERPGKNQKFKRLNRHIKHEAVQRADVTTRCTKTRRPVWTLIWVNLRREEMRRRKSWKVCSIATWLTTKGHSIQHLLWRRRSKKQVCCMDTLISLLLWWESMVLHVSLPQFLTSLVETTKPNV